MAMKRLKRPRDPIQLAISPVSAVTLKSTHYPRSPAARSWARRQSSRLAGAAETMYCRAALNNAPAVSIAGRWTRKMRPSAANITTIGGSSRMIVIFASTLSWNRNPNWMRQRQDRRCPSRKVFTCGFGRKSPRNRTDSRGCLTSALSVPDPFDGGNGIDEAERLLAVAQNRSPIHAFCDEHWRSR